MRLENLRIIGSEELQARPALSDAKTPFENLGELGENGTFRRHWLVKKPQLTFKDACNLEN